MTKYVAIGDLHFGFDKQLLPGGKWKKTPVHEDAAFRVFLQFAEKFRPDKILMMGDMFDMRPVCRHELDVPKKIEGQRLIEVYEKGFDYFINPILRLNAEVIWVDGNHEAWAYNLANKYPGIDGMIDPVNYLELRRRGIVCYPQGTILRLGKLAFAHGDGLVNGDVKYVAKKAVERYSSSIRIWHFHTYQVFTKETLKNKAYQTGVAVPCLCNRGPSYQTVHLNGWTHGFNYGFIEPNGEFHDYVAVIWRGKLMTAEGEVYRV
ncbi:MAG TPA: metallophosphoesterase [Bryobacteraceae bacterium]|nr:metallophosphoesterase [Bryobacteraceae bacterium]HPO87335.1 metallophosphoesterase [Candidatus Hydrogenedentota bacterium]